MKQQEVFKKIGTILKELNDQYEYLGEATDQLNDLELELFAANAHFLADHSQVLRKLNAQNAQLPVIKEEAPKPAEEKYFEPVVQQLPPEAPAKPVEVEVTKPVEDTPVPHIDLSANGADDDFSYIRQEPEVIKHELILDESENWEDEDDTGFEIGDVVEPEEEVIETPPVIEPEPVKKPEPVKEALVAEVKKESVPVEVKKEILPVEVKKTAAHVEQKTETITEEPLTINQMISAQLNKAAGKTPEHANAQPIADLKQAITLNDKLSYIKDLFNGYSLAYSEALDILNRFTTFDEAEDFLKTNYAAKNNWDSKQATADKFYALLRRRYS